MGVIQDYLLINDYNNSSLLNETFPIGTIDVTWTITDEQNQTSQCMQAITVEDSDGSCAFAFISPKIFLQGAGLNPNSGEEDLMRDDLRVAGLIPTISPYSDGAVVISTVFDATGNDAIVDWVWIELRDAMDNTIVSHSRSALLQRDGCLLYTSPSPRDQRGSRMPSSA